MKFIKSSLLKNNIKPLLAIFYTIGCIGLLFQSTAIYFQYCIPFNILISFIIVQFYHRSFNKSYLISLLLLFVFGFLIEVFGVKTGLLFGHYKYLHFLGPKLFEVPLLIGLNWAFLIYTSSCLFVNANFTIWQKAICIAFVMVIFDLALEFFAIKNSMWEWSYTTYPPLKNFIAWWIISFFMSLFYLNINKNKIENEIAKTILFIMFSFFLLFDLITWVNC